MFSILATMPPYNPFDLTPSKENPVEVKAALIALTTDFLAKEEAKLPQNHPWLSYLLPLFNGLLLSGTGAFVDGFEAELEKRGFKIVPVAPTAPDAPAAA